MKAQHNAAAWIMLAVVVVGIGIYLLIAKGPRPGGEAQPAPSATAPTSAAPTPAQPAIVGPTTDPLAATVHDEFTQRVLDFEEAYLMRRQPDGLARLAQFATEKYLQEHTPPSGGKYQLPADTTVVTVNRDLARTSVVVSGPGQDASVRYVTVTPVVSTSRPGPDGALVPVDTDRPAKLHATTWKLVDGVWQVDQER